jgi:predicted transcriptional regulator
MIRDGLPYPACLVIVRRYVLQLGMADTITIRTDDETEHALDVLTRGGVSRSAAIRQAVLEAASRRERAARMRREVLRMDLGRPDGANVAEELSRDRAGER